jgi:hypothetical protein
MTIVLHNEHHIRQAFIAHLPSLLLFLFLSGCGYTQLAEKRPDAVIQEEVNNDDNYQPEGDSLCLAGYYYEYDFNVFGTDQHNPRWIMGNLAHFGIKFQDAWYIANNKPHSGENIDFFFDDNLIYGQSLIVRLNPNNPEILRHHFYKCTPRPLTSFDKFWVHYSPSQVRQEGR